MGFLESKKAENQHRLCGHMTWGVPLFQKTSNDKTTAKMMGCKSITQHLVLLAGILFCLLSTPETKHTLLLDFGNNNEEWKLHQL